MCFFNSGLKLTYTEADLPDDRYSLVEIIRQLNDALLVKAEDVILSDLGLTRHQTAAIHHELYRKQYSCAPNSHHKNLSNARKKLDATDIEAPYCHKWQPEHRQKLKLMFEEALKPSADIEAVLSFDPRTFHESKLPAGIPALKEIALNMLDLLRGNPENIVLPDVSVAEKIILGALLVKPGFVSTGRLYAALYPPFIEEPGTPRNIEVHISRLRKKLGSLGIEIGSCRRQGYILDADNRRILWNLMAEIPNELNTSNRFLPVPRTPHLSYSAPSLPGSGVVDIHNRYQPPIAAGPAG